MVIIKSKLNKNKILYHIYLVDKEFRSIKQKFKIKIHMFFENNR